MIVAARRLRYTLKTIVPERRCMRVSRSILSKSPRDI